MGVTWAVTLPWVQSTKVCRKKKKRTEFLLAIISCPLSVKKSRVWSPRPLVLRSRGGHSRAPTSQTIASTDKRLLLALSPVLSRKVHSQKVGIGLA